MPEVLVSVVVPCYNHAGYLSECLRSVLAQTLSDWEAIVVDDGSTVGDVEQVVSRVHDSRCRIVKHTLNRGLGAARNTGFKAACAEWVLPLDSDDCLAPNFLEATVGALQDHPDADCVFTDFQLFGNSDDVWKNTVLTPGDMLSRQWIPGSGSLMRKLVWSRVGGYAEVYPFYSGNEDWDFWIGAVELGIKVVHVPQPLYLYRRVSGSMSITTLKNDDYLTREEIYRRHRKFFDIHGVGNKFRSDGYQISANASLKGGNRLHAARLALRGFAICPKRVSLLKLAFKTLLPEQWVKFVKRSAGLLQGRSQ